MIHKNVVVKGREDEVGDIRLWITTTSTPYASAHIYFPDEFFGSTTLALWAKCTCPDCPGGKAPDGGCQWQASLDHEFGLVEADHLLTFDVVDLLRSGLSGNNAFWKTPESVDFLIRQQTIPCNHVERLLHEIGMPFVFFEDSENQVEAFYQVVNDLIDQCVFE